jgi:hypothetical protein
MPFADAPPANYHRHSTAAKEVLALPAAWDDHVRCSTVKGRPLRLVVVGLLLACAATIWASAAFAAGPRQHKSEPSLKPLWSAFPLAHNQKPAQRQAPGANGVDGTSADDHSFRTLPLMGTAFLALLVVGGIAFAVVRHSRPALVGLPSRPLQGGFLMSNARRRLWGRSESEGPPEQEVGKPQGVVDRLSEYAPSENRSAIPAEDPPAFDESAAEQEPVTAQPNPRADLSAVGEEVAAVLESAEEAAAAIRRSAVEEAARRRAELEAEIAAEIEEVRRGADAEFADAQRIRTDADAYATETRASADKYGERRRTEADREAATIVAEAQSRLDEADSEAERKAREAEAGARARVDALKAEAGRYEERLDNIFVVFREMSSQLEELVGGRRAANPESPGDEELDEALRPDSSTTRAA